MPHRLGLLLSMALLISGLVGIPQASAGRPARTVRQLAKARAGLAAAIKRLDQRPTDRSAVQRATRHSKTLLKLADLYLHGAALTAPEARPLALALRPEFTRALHGGEAVLQVASDTVHLHTRVHRTLASACASQRRWRCEIEHLRALLALEGPTAERLGALAAAHDRARQPTRAAEVRAWLEGVSNEGVPAQR